MMLKNIFILFLFITTSTFAQNKKEFLYGPTLGYQNQNGNFAKLGAYALIDSGKNNGLKVDFNANLAYMKNDFLVIPEVGISYYIFTNSSDGIGYFAETEFTPFTFTPKIGVTLMTLMDFGFGYGFEINQKNNFKPIEGFQFSFGLNIPLNLKLKMM